MLFTKKLFKRAITVSTVSIMLLIVISLVSAQDVVFEDKKEITTQSALERTYDGIVAWVVNIWNRLVGIENVTNQTLSIVQNLTFNVSVNNTEVLNAIGYEEPNNSIKDVITRPVMQSVT